MKDLSSKQRSFEYYRPRLAKATTQHDALGWESEAAQLARFDILKQRITKGMSVLDVGCGFGRLAAFLGGDNPYIGIDIMPEMVEKAKSVYPLVDVRLVDIFKDNPFGTNAFDAVFASGIFNLNLGNNAEFLSLAIDSFVNIARKIVVFNLLSNRSTDKEDEYFYWDSDEIMAKFSHLGTVEIVDGYLDNDFSVVIRL